MDITEFRNLPKELERTNSIISLISKKQENILDIGARDGYFAKKFITHADYVVSIDIVTPMFKCPSVIKLVCNVENLPFKSDSFETVVCAEVLEHINQPFLTKACREIARVSKKNIIIGVPFRQELRIGRTTCRNCGGKNPPWGHQNSFNEKKLINLFKNWKVIDVKYVGDVIDIKTNWISSFLKDLCGNPWGYYLQEEPCIYCGCTLMHPHSYGFKKKLINKIATMLDDIQNYKKKTKPNWIHILFEKGKM